MSLTLSRRSCKASSAVHDGFVRRQGDGVDAANHAVDALADNLAEAVVNACLVLVVEGQRDGGFVARNDACDCP